MYPDQMGTTIILSIHVSIHTLKDCDKNYNNKLMLQSSASYCYGWTVWIVWFHSIVGSVFCVDR